MTAFAPLVNEVLEDAPAEDLAFWLGQAYATLMAPHDDRDSIADVALANSAARAVISFCNARNVR